MIIKCSGSTSKGEVDKAATMTYFLHQILRDCIPERYVIRTTRLEWHHQRTNDSCSVIGEFTDASSAYNAAAARGDALIYKGVPGDFDKKMLNRDDIADIR